MKNLVNTREALAVAILAFRSNGNRVVKDATDKQYANKSYLWSCFFPLKTTHKQLTVQLTDELLSAADDLKVTIEHAVTMEMLTKGYVPAFLKSIHDLLTEDTMHINNAGIIVWAPKLTVDIQRSRDIKEISAAYELSSKFVGKPGDRIEFDFTLIEKRFVRSIDTWSAYGHNEQGNLVQFLTKHEELCASGRIRARIKSHDNNRYHNMAKVTVVNFVKAT
jgi:hypothetical protein